MQPRLLVFALGVTVLTLSGCRFSVGDSDIKDVFADDEGDAASGNARRRPATNDEKL